MRRRELLKAGGLATLGLLLNPYAPMIFKRRILAGAPENNRKLIFIFQRGGNDGINTVIPHGDPAYNASVRPTLYIPPADAIDPETGEVLS